MRVSVIAIAPAMRERASWPKAASRVRTSAATCMAIESQIETGRK